MSNALAFGQGADHRGRDQGRDQIMVGPEPAERFGFLDHEGRQHDADLVAVERGPFALGSREVGTATPIRSASGSLAMTRSAPRDLASAIAASSVRGYSGLAMWSGTLGKSPSGVR